MKDSWRLLAVLAVVVSVSAALLYASPNPHPPKKGAAVVVAPPPPPPDLTVQFAHANFFTKDTAEFKEITVELSAVPTATVTVDYTTGDGLGKHPAAAGVNFKAVSGTLTFKPPSTSQKFKVPIIDTDKPGPNLRLNLVLGNPTGATLGTQGTAALTIVNDHTGKEPPVDSIYVTDEGNGVGADKDTPLGYFADGTLRFGFKWTVTRADADAMKKSVLTQDTFQLTQAKYDSGKSMYIVKDKDHPKNTFIKEKKEFDDLVKEWEKDKAVGRLGLDIGQGGEKIDGAPKVVMESFKGSALDGKRFSVSDYPGWKNLAVKYKGYGALEAVTIYQTYKVTSKLDGGKTITAVFTLKVEVYKDKEGVWKKKAAVTDPKLPNTWDK